MEKLSINACPVCGSTHLKRVMTCTDFYASGEQFELYSCEDCGFTFTQGVPVEAEIGKYYCLLYTSPSPRDATLSRMPSSA